MKQIGIQMNAKASILLIFIQILEIYLITKIDWQ